MPSADARTVSFSVLLVGTARRCGLNPLELGIEEAEALAEHLTGAAGKAHRAYDWPDVLALEERPLRPYYDPAMTYTLGEEVYDPTGQRFYRAILDTFAGQPVDDDAYWEPITDLRRALPLLEPGRTPMAEILAVFDRDPDTDAQAQQIGYRLGQGELLLDPASTLPVVWVRFRVPPPRFTRVDWSSATDYQAGDLAYLAPHCYLSLTQNQGTGDEPSEESETWRVQDVPELLEDVIKDLAKAEWLSSSGQDERAIALRRASRDDLDDTTATIERDQGQTRRYRVATRHTFRGSVHPRRF